MPWMVKVNPSAFALVSWKLKSVTNDCTLTAVLKKALLASAAPPSVNRKRVPLIPAPPFSVKPEEVKPLPKLGEPPVVWIVYVAVATTLLVNPLAAAMALTVFVALTVIGTVNWAEDVVGVLPSVV